MSQMRNAAMYPGADSRQEYPPELLTSFRVAMHGRRCTRRLSMLAASGCWRLTRLEDGSASGSTCCVAPVGAACACWPLLLSTSCTSTPALKSKRAALHASDASDVALTAAVHGRGLAAVLQAWERTVKPSSAWSPAPLASGPRADAATSAELARFHRPCLSRMLRIVWQVISAYARPLQCAMYTHVRARVCTAYHMCISLTCCNKQDTNWYVCTTEGRTAK